MPTHYTGSTNTRIALDTFIKVTRAVNALEHRLYQSEVISPLTSTQFGVLETLYHLGPLCQGELSEKLLKSSGNVTLVLDNLEKQGWIERIRQSDDRRKIVIHLTQAGKDLISPLFPKVAAEIEKIFSALTTQEQQSLGDLTKKLGKSI
jgi:MarR family transcriptional regulator, 2-MHQ and catechol-resistance regulon repressor